MRHQQRHEYRQACTQQCHVIEKHSSAFAVPYFRVSCLQTCQSQRYLEYACETSIKHSVGTCPCHVMMVKQSWYHDRDIMIVTWHYDRDIMMVTS
jgi:hypothetical protein